MKDTKLISFTKYSKKGGLPVNNDGKCEAFFNDAQLHIKADSKGLLALAELLVSLAQEGTPNGYHFHLDEYTFFDNEAVEVVIEKQE